MPQKPVKKSKKNRLTSRTRREMLRSIAFGAVVIGASALGFFPVIKKWVQRLRPPGALEENAFLSACIKCGQCSQVCPVDAIKLGDLDEGFGVGVPYIVPRAQACDFACEAPQCILACPTEALSPKVKKKEDVRMGLARLSRPNSCLARQGKGFKGQVRGADFTAKHRYVKIDRWNPIRISQHPYDLEICDLCVRECPIEGAISMEPLTSDPNDKRQTPVVHDKCVGCGTCEMFCPLDEAAIVIDIRKKWSDL